jgi:hypothetical protein
VGQAVPLGHRKENHNTSLTGNWTVPALADSREVGNRLSVKEDGDGIVAAEVHG